MTLDAELARGLHALQVHVAAGIEQKLLDYIGLVQKWNRVYNLTAVREPDRMLTHHVLDSLAIVPHLSGRHIVDVGSGAGFPGIPVALALPHSRVILLESSHKKSAFLKQAIIELGLRNADVQHARAEAWRPVELFDTVISRALGEVGQFVSVAAHLCAQDGLLAAMKGVYPYEELNHIPPGYTVRAVKQLLIPGLDAARHLILIGRANKEL